MLRFVILYIISLFLIFSPVKGEAIVLDDQTEDLELSNLQYEILKDSTRKLTIEDVCSSLYNNQFQTSKEAYNYVEEPEVAYWLRFQLRDQSIQKKKWVLEFLSVQTEHLEFFSPSGKGSFEKKTIGQLHPFSIRDYHVTNFVFDIPAVFSEEDYFYVRILSKHPSGFEFRIRSQQYFTSYAVNEYYFLGIYYGILLIMAVYNFLLFFSSREKVYLFYVLYVLSCMVNSFAEDGFGFQFAWPMFPEWNWDINIYLSSFFFLLTFVLYATSFLELKKQSAKFWKLIFGTTLAYFAFSIIGFIFPVPINFSFLYVLPFLMVYIAAVFLYKSGYKPARFFILGYSFVFVSIIILQLRNYNLIPHNIFTVYSFNYGIVLEVVVLSFALGDRIKLMKQEKEKAQRILITQLEENQKLQQKVNKELEEKVGQRTKLLVQKTGELEEANEKLRKMTEELNKFASKLDQDNWDLNKKVIEEKKARMYSKGLSYEEFIKIFPTDFACLKYIEEMKWGQGYECKKCGHNKFAVKAKLLSRKCSRCNYIESVTSSTIFHALKFPIQKAFFIAYITSVKQQKISVDRLSEVLDLNRLTCYKFRKKVLARELVLLEKTKTDRIENWENLIIEA